MTTYRANFEIGPNLGSMVNVETVVANPPFQDSFVVGRLAFEQADALVSAHGWGETAWHWGFISVTDYNALKVYCPDKSAELYVRVRGGSTAYVYCKAVMVWPQEPEPATTNIITNFGVQLRILQNYGGSSQ